VALILSEITKDVSLKMTKMRSQTEGACARLVSFLENKVRDSLEKLSEGSSDDLDRLMLLFGFQVLFVICLAKYAVAAEVNRHAPKGGRFEYNLRQEPARLFPLEKWTVVNSEVMRFGCSRLLERDLNTYEWIPAIAEKWEISRDNREFTFKLRKDAYFHDGSRVTAEDVKFSFEEAKRQSLSGKFGSAFMDGLKSIEIIDSQTIKFHAKDTYYQNFGTIYYVYIIPKHIYGVVNARRSAGEGFVCAGPYKFESWDLKKKIVLKKFDRWFGRNQSEWAGYYNFDTIVFHFIQNNSKLVDLIAKKQVDYSPVVTFNKKSDKRVKKLAKRVVNKTPMSSLVVGVNFRNSVLKDQRVRRALSLLFDRESINRKFFEKAFELANGPFPLNSNYNSGGPSLEFSPSRARALLTEAGWLDSNGDGVLDKSSKDSLQNLELVLAFNNRTYEPALSAWVAEARKSGVVIKMRYYEGLSIFDSVERDNVDLWTFNLMDDQIEEDPTAIYHSPQMGQIGYNLGNYVNPEVDRLLEDARMTVQYKKRIESFRKLGNMLRDDLPFIYLFSSKNIDYLVSDRVGRPADTFNYGIGVETWWLNEN
jgi:peptide/nickel transport system substrate-binding protein/microcin C transport system substrate-binding protein